VLALHAPLAFGLPTYTVTPLPTADATFVDAKAINNQGIVVGRVQFGGPPMPFFADRIALTNIGLSLANPLGSANAINSIGQIVGNGGTTGSFLYDHGAVTELPTLGGIWGGASGINDQGWVVGVTQDARQQFQGYIYKNGATTQLQNLTPSRLDATSVPSAINDAGVIVGMSSTLQSTAPVYWTPTGDVVALNLQGATGGTPYAINDLGQIVGGADYAGSSNGGPFLWENGNTKFLGMPGITTATGTFGVTSGTATSINAIGEVVGSVTLSDGTGVGFMWTATTGMVDINALLDPASKSWFISGVIGINDFGQIVAASGSRVLLLDPIQVTSVPAPGPLLLLGVGLALIGLRRKYGRVSNASFGGRENLLLTTRQSISWRHNP